MNAPVYVLVSLSLQFLLKKRGMGYRDEPFVLAKDVTQVFYVQDMSSILRKDKSRNKSSFVGAGDEPKRHIILAEKKKIVGVDDVIDEEEYNKVEDMTPFVVEVDTSILLAEEEAPYARHDHNEGTIVKWTIVNISSVTVISRFRYCTRLFCSRSLSVPQSGAP